MRVLVLVGMPVWWNIQCGHVLFARCAAPEADCGDFAIF